MNTGAEWNVNGLRSSAIVGLFMALLAGLSGAAFAQATARTAPESSWPAVLDAARKEGSVTLYTQIVPSINDRIKADFAKAHPGITLEVVRITGNSILTKLDQERQSGSDGGDVAITVELLWLEDRVKEGNLRKPVGPSRQAWPGRYLLSDTIPVLSLEPLVMAYNTSIAKSPVTGYQDLLRPEFKGRLGTTGVQALSIVAWYEWLERSQGGDFLAKLASQGPRVYTGAVPNAQAVASGEIGATAFSVPAAVMQLIETGAPVKLVIPNPALGIRWGAGIIASSRRPNASQVLMDYLMSPRGQTAWHSRGESASPLPKIPGSADVNSIQAFDPSVYNANSIADYKKKWDVIFSK